MSKCSLATVIFFCGNVKLKIAQKKATYKYACKKQKDFPTKVSEGGKKKKKHRH